MFKSLGELAKKQEAERDREIQELRERLGQSQGLGIGETSPAASSMSPAAENTAANLTELTPPSPTVE